MNKLAKLRDEKAKVSASMKAMTILCEKESRDFDDDEQASWDQFDAKIQSIDVAIARQERLADIERSMPAIVDPNRKAADEATRIDADQIRGGEPRIASDPMCGFKSSGHFWSDLIHSGTGRTNRVSNPEGLKYLAAQGSDEQLESHDAYGGYLVPEEISSTLLSTMAEADPFAGKTMPVPMQSSSISFNARVDKDHSTSVSGGFRVYRGVETQDSTSSRGEFEQIRLTLNRMTGLVHVSDDLIADSPISITGIINAGFTDEFAAKMTEERLDGTGVGEFEGINNSPALITVDKEDTQTSDTIVYENIINMRARVWRYGASGVFWLANHDVIPQLAALNQSVGTAGGQLVWAPNATADVPDLLLGKPIFFSEFPKTLGDAGDILCINASQYMDGFKGGMEQTESIHVRFAAGERSFRFVRRNDGKAWWRSPLTPKNGSSLSAFVRLQARV